MKLNAVLLVGREDRNSDLSIKCLEESKINDDIKFIISIRRELFERKFSTYNFKNVKLLVQERQPSSLFEHMKLITSKIECDYIMFLHDDDIFDNYFIMLISQNYFSSVINVNCLKGGSSLIKPHSSNIFGSL